MVCCGAFGGQNVDKAQQVNQYKAEIQIAESMGIDGFGLDIMEPNDAYHTIGDDLYITTALTAPARLEVVSGPTTFYYDLPGGLNQTVVPFEIGSQSFSLWRNSTRIAAVDGEPVVVSIDYYDYWPTIGCVEAHPPGQPVNPSVPHVAQ